MKISNIISKIAIAVTVITAFTISSCTNTDDVTTPNTSVSGNTGPLNLMALDTAKVIRMSENGTSPTVVLNRKFNLSSYFNDFCISTDGTKFIYVDTQSTGMYPNTVRTVKLRIANFDGTNDTDLFSAQSANQGSSISSIRYCSDGKIFFAYRIGSGAGSLSTLTYNTINADGTGLVAATSANYGEYFDISNDRKYIVGSDGNPGATNVKAVIYDRTLDNGAGGIYHTENVANGIILKNSIFTNDGKSVIIPFIESNTIKIKIVNMATKTAVIKTLLSNLSSPYISFKVNMASDSTRGVLTVRDNLSTQKSKSYVFNSSTGVVSAPFENNDENVIDVFAY